MTQNIAFAPGRVEVPARRVVEVPRRNWLLLFIFGIAGLIVVVLVLHGTSMHLLTFALRLAIPILLIIFISILYTNAALLTLDGIMKVDNEGLKWEVDEDRIGAFNPFANVSSFSYLPFKKIEWPHIHLQRLSPLFKLSSARRAARHGAFGRYGLRFELTNGSIAEFTFERPDDWLRVATRILEVYKQKGWSKSSFLVDSNLEQKLLGRELWEERFAGKPEMNLKERNLTHVQSLIISVVGVGMMATALWFGLLALGLGGFGLIILSVLIHIIGDKKAWQKREKVLENYLRGLMYEDKLDEAIKGKRDKYNPDTMPYPKKITNRRELGLLLDYLNSSEQDRYHLQNNFQTPWSIMTGVALGFIITVYIFLTWRIGGWGAGFSPIKVELLVFFHAISLGLFLTFLILPKYVQTEPTRLLTSLMRLRFSELALVLAIQIGVATLTLLWFEKFVLLLLDVMIWTPFYPQLRPTLVEKKPLHRLGRLYLLPLVVIGLADFLITMPIFAFIPIIWKIICVALIGVVIHGRYVYRYGDCMATLWLGTPQFLTAPQQGSWPYRGFSRKP